MKLGLLLPLLLLTLPSRARAAADPREVVLSSMRAELARSMERLKLPGYEPPYFISYLVRDTETCQLVARYGALYSNVCGRGRTAYVEVRVGDYTFDNTSGES